MIPQPTHYSLKLSARGGVPVVGPEDSFEEGEPVFPLPESWDERFWEWSSPGMASGEWVERTDEVRQQVWEDTKVARAEALSTPVDVTIKGVVYTFATDKDSLDVLHRKLGVATNDPTYTFPWILPDNTTITLGKQELVTIVKTIEEANDDLILWSQQARQHISDGSTLIHSVAELPIKRPQRSKEA